MGITSERRRTRKCACVALFGVEADGAYLPVDWTVWINLSSIRSRAKTPGVRRREDEPLARYDDVGRQRQATSDQWKTADGKSLVSAIDSKAYPSPKVKPPPCL